MSTQRETLLNNAVFIPEGSRPTSYDPLDADIVNNLSVMRMIHLTPLEVSVHNRLTSQILSSFQYDVEKRRARFVVRSDRTFSDGKKITASDVAFSIARMAHARPKFPVLSEIDGLQAWLQTAHPLESSPKGIVVDGEVIDVFFARPVDNPLFRFVLEIFSIIPKSSVDLKTGCLLVQQPPTSGNYVIAEVRSHEIDFSLRSSPRDSHEINVPNKITFRYDDAGVELENFHQYPQNLIFSGLDLALRTGRIDLEGQGVSVTWMPASDFAFILLNPNAEVFKDAKCRRFFSRELRKETVMLFSGKESEESDWENLGVEASLFPKIVPGYMSTQAIEKAQAGPDKEESAHCLAKLRREGLKVSIYKEKKHLYYNRVILGVAKRLSIPVEIASVTPSYDEHVDLFLKSKSDCLFMRSGFWPLDPVGDIRMLFAPEMHASLKFLWSDTKLVSQIDELGNETDPLQIKNRMEAISRYVNAEARMNVMVHYRSFFASAGRNTLRPMPMAVQQPYPWQVFNVE